MGPANSEQAAGSRGLPLGMGYKSCWMVVEGAAQKAVADAFLQGRKMKYPYEAGLKKVERASAKENRLLVTTAHKKQVYVIGAPVSQFFYETEEFLAKCRDFSRVYVYMSHRISETHGFALVENGELVRFFKYDENEIKNVGQPLPEEAALGYRLPETFEDVWNEEENFTQINEDMIVALAICQTGIDVQAYPYQDVKVGKRFEYAADLAKDPYPRDGDAVSAETWALPEVRRFSQAETCREKLEIFLELRDRLTHPIINAMGELADAYAGYGRLSERVDELYRMLRDQADTEARTITQAEFLTELGRGVSRFEDKIFERVSFQALPSRKLTFHKCFFLHVRFMGQQGASLALDGCRFAHSDFCGSLQNTALTLCDVFFDHCRVHDLVLSGDSAPSQLTDCRFFQCEFTNLKLCADLTVSDGWFSCCTGDSIHISRLRGAALGREPTFRESCVTNCYVNGELKSWRFQ